MTYTCVGCDCVTQGDPWAELYYNGKRKCFCDSECLARWSVEFTALYEVEQLDRNV